MRVSFLAPLLVAGVSPVQKVIQLLGELKTKVQNDLDAEGKSMDEYTQFCDDEITERGFSIKTATGKIEEYQAVIEESTGKISSYSAAIEKGGASTAAKGAELAEAQDVRNGENKDFNAGEKELVDTVDTLARAATVLKRELSFAQGGSVSKKLGSMLTALTAIVDAQNNDSASKVKAFLEEDDLSLLAQPQAHTKNYESKSGGIVEAVQNLQDKAEEELQQLRKDETKKRHAFELLKQSLEDAIANEEKEVAEATSNKSTTEETKAQAEEDLGKTQASKAADEKYLKKMQTECQATARNWEERQKSGAEELAALDKAKEILSTGVKAFVQTKTSTHRVKAVELQNETREQIVSALRKLGRQFNSFALMQMAGQASSDPFVKIRGMIEAMITKLVKQSDEEATQEAFCQEENKKSAAKRETTSAKVDKLTARIDEAKATKEQLKQEVAALQKEIHGINTSQAKATQIRAENNSDYKKASKDFKESAEAVSMAIEVLSEFYGSNDAAFVQQPQFGGSKSDSAGGIVSFLEVAQSDFTRLLAETETQEAEQKAAFEQLSQDNQVSLATKNASVKGKNSETKSLGVAIANTGSDLENSNSELDAILEYIEKLKPQCESKAMTYAERKARRDAEVAGLKSALEILSGEAPAVFLQNKAFLSKN